MDFVGLGMFYWDEILLQHRDDRPGLRDSGLWVLPGGGVEVGESLIEAVQREFLEETGYQVLSPGYVVTIRDCHAQDPEVGFIGYLHFFTTTFDGHSPPECLEGQALAFVKLNDVHELARPRYLDFVIGLARLACRQSLPGPMPSATESSTDH